MIGLVGRQPVQHPDLPSYAIIMMIIITINIIVCLLIIHYSSRRSAAGAASGSADAPSHGKLINETLLFTKQ